MHGWVRLVVFIWSADCRKALARIQLPLSITFNAPALAKSATDRLQPLEKGDDSVCEVRVDTEGPGVKAEKLRLKVDCEQVIVVVLSWQMEPTDPRRAARERTESRLMPQLKYRANQSITHDGQPSRSTQGRGSVQWARAAENNSARTTLVAPHERTPKVTERKVPIRLTLTTTVSTRTVYNFALMSNSRIPSCEMSALSLGVVPAGARTISETILPVPGARVIPCE